MCEWCYGDHNLIVRTVMSIACLGVVSLWIDTVRWTGQYIPQI